MFSEYSYHSWDISKNSDRISIRWSTLFIKFQFIMAMYTRSMHLRKVDVKARACTFLLQILMHLEWNSITHKEHIMPELYTDENTIYIVDMKRRKNVCGSCANFSHISIFIDIIFHVPSWRFQVLWMIDEWDMNTGCLDFVVTFVTLHTHFLLIKCLR